MSCCIKYHVVMRQGLRGNVVQCLLQDLSAGQTMEQAIERFGITFAAFESDLERRVGAKGRAASAR